MSDNSDSWEQLEENRDVFETIVEQGGPFEPHARRILVGLDEREDDGRTEPHRGGGR